MVARRQGITSRADSPSFPKGSGGWAPVQGGDPVPSGAPAAALPAPRTTLLNRSDGVVH